MDICTLLSDESWIDRALAKHQTPESDIDKLYRLERFKITQARGKIARVQEGCEGGLYELDEAKRRTAGYHDAIAKAEAESARLRSLGTNTAFEGNDLEAIKGRLKALREQELGWCDL